MKAPTKKNAEFEVEPEVATEAAVVSRRQNRQPLNGRSLKLQVFGAIPGYHLYIAKDEGARISMMQGAGYEFVKANEIENVGRGVSSYNTDPGGSVRFILGNNGSEPVYGYLMKIPEEFWQEDQQALEAVNAEIDSQIKLGRVRETQDDRRYTPKGGVTYEPKTPQFFKPGSKP